MMTNACLKINMFGTMCSCVCLDSHLVDVYIWVWQPVSYCSCMENRLGVLAPLSWTLDPKYNWHTKPIYTMLYIGTYCTPYYSQCYPIPIHWYQLPLHWN